MALRVVRTMRRPRDLRQVEVGERFAARQRLETQHLLERPLGGLEAIAQVERQAVVVLEDAVDLERRVDRARLLVDLQRLRGILRQQRLRRPELRLHEQPDDAVLVGLEGRHHARRRVPHEDAPGAAAPRGDGERIDVRDREARRRFGLDRRLPEHAGGDEREPGAQPAQVGRPLREERLPGTHVGVRDRGHRQQLGRRAGADRRQVRRPHAEVALQAEVVPGQADELAADQLDVGPLALHPLKVHGEEGRVVARRDEHPARLDALEHQAPVRLRQVVTAEVQIAVVCQDHPDDRRGDRRGEDDLRPLGDPREARGRHEGQRQVRDHEPLVEHPFPDEDERQQEGGRDPGAEQQKDPALLRPEPPEADAEEHEADAQEFLPEERRRQRDAREVEAPGALEVGVIGAPEVGPDLARRARVAHAEEGVARRKDRQADERRQEGRGGRDPDDRGDAAAAELADLVSPRPGVDEHRGDEHGGRRMGGSREAEHRAHPEEVRAALRAGHEPEEDREGQVEQGIGLRERRGIPEAVACRHDHRGADRRTVGGHHF